MFWCFRQIVVANLGGLSWDGGNGKITGKIKHWSYESWRQMTEEGSDAHVHSRVQLPTKLCSSIQISSTIQYYSIFGRLCSQTYC